MSYFSERWSIFTMSNKIPRYRIIALKMKKSPAIVNENTTRYRIFQRKFMWLIFVEKISITQGPLVIIHKLWAIGYGTVLGDQNFFLKSEIKKNEWLYFGTDSKMISNRLKQFKTVLNLTVQDVFKFQGSIVDKPRLDDRKFYHEPEACFLVSAATFGHIGWSIFFFKLRRVFYDHFRPISDWDQLEIER